MSDVGVGGLTPLVEAVDNLRVTNARCTDSIGLGAHLVDVALGDWLSAARELRQTGATYLDFLTGYVHADELDVVLHVCTPDLADGVMLRTHVEADVSIASLVGVYPGVNWYERETAEMLGLVFDGHPNPEHLLLPKGFQGYPLLKSYALTPRVDHMWPGEVEPADRNARPRTRRKSLPPGVLAEWSLAPAESLGTS